MQQRSASGRDYLELVTTLLQRARLADDEAGLYEAADFQWWWRRDQHDDPANATFWLGDGLPLGAVILTNWGRRGWGCDVIALPSEIELASAELWPHALARMERLPGATIEVAVGDDDTVATSVLKSAGFRPSEADDSLAMTCWMAATDHPAIPPLATGYRLMSTADRARKPHHMVSRNGHDVGARLRECSLYRPELDLYIEAPGGAVAAYGLFWADRTTGVGLVEPMRTEDAHQNMGLGKHLLRSGLQRLAEHGCNRLKVTYMEGNEPARLLYVNSGFQPRTRSQTYGRADP